MAADQYGDMLPAGAVARLGSVRFGPNQRATTLAFSPDGRFLASGGDDRVVHLWDVATGRQVRRCDDQSDKVGAVAFSADGQVLVSDSVDGHVYLWEAATCHGLLQFPIAAGGVLFFQFSPDGNTLDCGFRDGTIHTLDPTTGEAIRNRPAAAGPVKGLALSPDGKVVASTSWETTVRLWDVETGKELRQLVGHRSPLNAVAFTPNGRTVISAGDDEVIRLSELASGNLRRQFPGQKGGVLALAVAPDGRSLASAGVDRTILIWDVTGRAEEGPRRPTSLMPSQLELLWSDLSGVDAANAFRALWDLARYPKQSLPFLKNKLRMLVPVDRQKITALLADLGHDQISVREKATLALEKFGALCEPALKAALQKPPGQLEVRRRLDNLLKRLDEPTPSPDMLLALRVVEALEMTGTAEARQILDGLARETPPTRLAQEAKATLQRLAKLPVTPG